MAQRATFDKRYITLAPVAGVVGLGFELRDPEGLLKGEGGEGFTASLPPPPTPYPIPYP